MYSSDSKSRVVIFSSSLSDDVDVDDREEVVLEVCHLKLG